MIVAEITVLTSHGFMASAYGHIQVKFDDLSGAEAEYERITALLKRRDEKANDIPKIVEIVGSGSKARFPLEDLRCVSLVDYDESNRQQSGLKEAFPNIF